MTSRLYDIAAKIGTGALLTFQLYGCTIINPHVAPRVDKCADYKTRDDLAITVSMAENPQAFKDIKRNVLLWRNGEMNNAYKADLDRMVQHTHIVPEDGCNERSYAVILFKDDGDGKFDPMKDRIYVQCAGPKKSDAVLGSALGKQFIPESYLLQIAKKEMEQMRPKK